MSPDDKSWQVYDANSNAILNSGITGNLFGNKPDISIEKGIVILSEDIIRRSKTEDDEVTFNKIKICRLKNKVPVITDPDTVLTTLDEQVYHFSDHNLLFFVSAADSAWYLYDYLQRATIPLKRYGKPDFVNGSKRFVAYRKNNSDPTELYDVVTRRVVAVSPAGNVYYTGQITEDEEKWIVEINSRIYVYDFSSGTWLTMPGVYKGLNAEGNNIIAVSKEQDRIRFFLFPDPRRNTREALDKFYPSLTKAMRKKLGIE
jgi:hypothetical protein